MVNYKFNHAAEAAIIATMNPVDSERRLALIRAIDGVDLTDKVWEIRRSWFNT